MPFKIHKCYKYKKHKNPSLLYPTRIFPPSPNPPIITSTKHHSKKTPKLEVTFPQTNKKQDFFVCHTLIWKWHERRERNYKFHIKFLTHAGFLSPNLHVLSMKMREREECQKLSKKRMYYLWPQLFSLFFLVVFGWINKWEGVLVFGSVM